MGSAFITHIQNWGNCLCLTLCVDRIHFMTSINWLMQHTHTYTHPVRTSSEPTWNYISHSISKAHSRIMLRSIEWNNNRFCFVVLHIFLNVHNWWWTNRKPIEHFDSFTIHEIYGPFNLTFRPLLPIEGRWTVVRFYQLDYNQMNTTAVNVANLY